MAHLRLFSIFLLFIAINLSSQNNFTKILGGLEEEFGVEITQASNGDFFVISNKEENLYLLKLDSKGELFWDSIYNDSIIGNTEILIKIDTNELQYPMVISNFFPYTKSNYGASPVVPNG